MRPLEEKVPADAKVIEIIGPAGSGKSVLARHLAGGIPLSLWGQAVPSLAVQAARLAPVALSSLIGGRRLSAEEFTQMARQAALQERVVALRRRGGRAVLDEGPLFNLGWFQVFHPERGTHRFFRRWRSRILEHWVSMLDMVIYLDGPDDLLVSRIRTRPKPHMIKSSSDREIHAFNNRFREAFEGLLAELPSERGPVVLRRWIDGEESAEDLSRAVSGAPMESDRGR